MEVTLKIFRYNPEKDKKPSYKTYKLEGWRPTACWTCLKRLKATRMGRSLSADRARTALWIGCDANQRMNRLACKTLVRDVGVKITVEPILGLSVIKDLIVDMNPFLRTTARSNHG